MAKTAYKSSMTLVPATLATDLLTFTPNASKVTTVKSITISGTQTTAGLVDFYLLTRSEANTGGTSTSGTALRVMDSGYAGVVAAGAVVTGYTANPSALGTTSGTLHISKAEIGTASTVNDSLVWNFPQGFVLEEVLAVNLNGVTLTGGSITVVVEWTEEG